MTSAASSPATRPLSAALTPATAPRSSHGHAALVYGVAIFLSSWLLFLIEPIAGKRLLPLLGGSAAVWMACLVFFQCALLLGYFAAHVLVTRASAKGQAVAYVGLLLLSLGQLTYGVRPELHATTARPIASVLWLLTLLIGLPFVTLSATSPLLQAWYSRAMARVSLGGETGRGVQPYRLFAVSNVGSLVALVIYPWLIEPRLSLRHQTAGLTIGFAILAVVCALIANSVRSEKDPAAVARMIGDASEAEAAPIAVGAALLWISLAACGSLLLSAVTNHLSQNVATIPLLWIVPLIAYLLSFVVAFSSGGWHPRWLVLPLGLAGLAAAGFRLYKGDLGRPIGMVVSTFCLSLFVLCLFCHSELYRRRPEPSRLTTFYFCVAAGGAIGAIAVGVLAPSLLTGNYELVIGLCIAALLGLMVTWGSGLYAHVTWATAAVLLCSLAIKQVRDDRVNALLRVRNFYGTLEVSQVDDGTYHVPVRTLYHGVIEHGQQVFSTALGKEPTTYYGHPSGVGLAIDLCCGNRPRRVGVIGLGTGTLAAYGRPGDVFRFYDINPAVDRIAHNYFAFLRNSLAHVDVVIGDARVSLAGEAPQRYDVLAVDAFSGDAIPVHLLTSEALELYRRHLAPGGIVAFHISNRYLNLGPVVQQLADHAGMQTAFISSDDDTPHDLYSADWVLVTDNTAFLGQPAVAHAREKITIPPGVRRWTDDYNSLLPVLRMKRSGDSD